MKYLIGLLLLVLCSCSREIHFPDPVDKDTTVCKDPIKKIAFANIFSQDTNKYRYLGYGYDCTISNFDGVAVPKARVLDVDRFLRGEGYDVKTKTVRKMEPGSIEESILHSGKYQRFYGYDFGAYQQTLLSYYKISHTLENRNLTLFYKEFYDAFNDETIFSNGSSFYKINKTLFTRRLTMSNVYPEKFKFFLSEEFLQDLYRLRSDEIIQKYGTHVLTDILLGGTCSFLFNAVVTETNQDLFKRQAFDFTDMVYTNKSPGQDTIFFQGFKDVNICIRTIGGTVPVTQIEMENDSKVFNNYSFHYAEWLKTIDVTNEQLVNIGNPTTRIFLISEFIEDPVKREEVEVSILKYNSHLLIKNRP